MNKYKTDMKRVIIWNNSRLKGLTVTDSLIRLSGTF